MGRAGKGVGRTAGILASDTAKTGYVGGTTLLSQAPRLTVDL